MYKKPVIVFEGIECSGKSFHINSICNYLKKKKIPFIKLREPGGSKNSEKIRKLILDKKSNFTKDTDLLLYLAARSENISLLKKYYRKRLIIIDRFVDSTIAYQHYGLGVNLSLIKTINNHLLNNFKVDLTFLNLVNKKNFIHRLKKRKLLNRYDKFNFKFYMKVQKGFLKLRNINKKKYFVVDSNLDIKKNKEEIKRKIENILS